MSNADWLANLKAGDEVAVTYQMWHGHFSLCRVSARTPASILVEWGRGSKMFAPDGKEIGGNAWLEEMTAEMWEKHERSELVRKLTNWPWLDVPLAVLRRAAELVEGGQGE